MDTSLNNKIFVDAFLIEDMSMVLYESKRSCSLLLSYSALINCLGKAFLMNVIKSILETICLNIIFFPNFR